MAGMTILSLVLGKLCMNQTSLLLTRAQLSQDD